MLDSALYQEDLKKVNETDLPWEELENQNVLITGGTGLIGSCLADALIFRNEHMGAQIGIWVLCRNEARAREVFGSFLEKPYFHLIVQDICEPLEPETFVPCVAETGMRTDSGQSGENRQNGFKWEQSNGFATMDYIIHAASKGDPDSFVADPLGVMEANLTGLRNIIAYARRFPPKKILYLSSGEAYGKLKLSEQETITEEMSGVLDSLNVRNCYGVSKRAAETMCVSAAYEYQIPVCIARVCHTYGPTMTTGENRVIFQFLGNALRGEDIVLKSAGTQRRSYCYVTDAVRGLLGILFRGESGEAYNVSNRQSVITIRELAELAASCAGSSVHCAEQTEAERRGDSGIMHAVLDDRKVVGLGIAMEYDMKTGFRRTVEILKHVKGYKVERNAFSTSLI